MNKQQITKQYGVLMLALAAISMVILLVTAFVPAFEMNLGLIEGSENSMDYLFLPLFEDESTGSSIDEENFEIVLLDGFVERLIMRGVAIFFLLFPVLFVLTNRKHFSKLEETTAVSQMFSTIKDGIFLNVAYYVFCMYIILREHDWDFVSAIKGETLITTQTFLPLIFQAIVFAVSMFLYNHWDKALAGTVAPINLGIAVSAQSTHQTPSAQPMQNTQAETKTVHNPRSAQSEMESLELLKKYKELLDNQIITEEEFNAKKEELLSFNQQDSQTVAPDTNEHQEAPIAEPIAETVQKQDRTTVKAAHSGKNIICTCKKCGYPINPDQQVCPHCSAKVKVKEKVITYGMKWYKCLIYFVLFASAALNVISSISYFTGAAYGGYAEAVYETYPILRFIDLFGGILCLALAVFAIMIRSDLVWYRKRTSKRLCAMYIVTGIFNPIYAVVLTLITGQNLITASSIIALIGGVVMAIINHNYFKKRKDIFKF